MEKTDRLHALDAVRAFALLLGIVLHATMSFVPGMAIPVADSSPSTALAVTFYVIHVFRMTLFFMVAGFFAHLVFHRQGLAGFLRDRRKRILMPLIAAWAVLCPLVLLAVIWGQTRMNHGVMPAMPVQTDPPLLPFPLVHFWFLYLLLWMYAFALAGRAAFDRLTGKSAAARGAMDRWMQVLVRGYALPLVLALPLGACLYFTPSWRMWGGIPTPDSSLIPNLPALIGFGTAFAFGWLLHRQADLIRVWEKRWVFHLALAIAFTLTSLMLSAQQPPGWTRLAYVACYTLAMWNWTFGLIGVSLRFFSAESARRRYVADSSYWLYLAHLPLVMFLQVAVSQWNVHWAVKFPLILALATSILLLSYRYLVRPTYIGEVLNGRRYPRHEERNVIQAIHRSPITAATGVAPLACLQAVRKSFGTTVVLSGLDLEVRPGELLAVLGPNGAGKTTAISLLLGLQQVDAGSATLFGQSPELLDARRRIGIMMQEVALSAELSVAEHIDLVCSYYPSPYSVAEVMRITRTTELAQRRYGKLSGGQKRQVQFALAICGRPQLLFLDEPTVGLDIQARELMWDTIRELVKQGCSIVLTTHYLEEAESLADRVVVMVNGRPIASGSVGEMRALVARKRISCVTALAEERVRAWSGVESVTRDKDRLHVTAIDAEVVVRHLLAADENLRELEVRRAGLSEAFAELTQEAA